MIGDREPLEEREKHVICRAREEREGDQTTMAYSLPVLLQKWTSIKSKEQFDFIFADPPYDLRELETLPDLIFQNNLLKEDGLFVLEHGKTSHFEDHPHFIEKRVYGSVNFSFFSSEQRSEKSDD